MRVSKDFIEKAVNEDGYVAVWIDTQLLIIRANDALVSTSFGTMYPDRDDMIRFVSKEKWKKVERKDERWVVEK